MVSLGGGLDPAGGRRIPAIGEARLLRAHEELGSQLRDVSDADKAARIALRFSAALFSADHGCLAMLTPGTGDASIVELGGRAARTDWPALALADFARARKPELPASVAVARLRRRRRPWGTLALRWDSDEPDWDTRNALTRLAAVTNDAIERIESRRLAEVRARIDRKILEQLRPKDLLYQILDGLRSLTGYDHSGAILLRAQDSPAFELVAEQMAFRKGKSPRIGLSVPMPLPLLSALASDEAWGYSADGEGDRWSPWSHDAPADLPAWLTAALPPAAVEAPPQAEMICAPLRAGGNLTGLIRIGARHHGTFGPYEGELVAAFLPHAMIALQNARRVESLEDKVIQAERRHAMAELARGVSHDINNALGAVLPLVQQMRDDIQSGRADPGTLSDDLSQVEQSLRTCTRIFGGMLQFGRRAAHDPGSAEARLETALDSALAILGEGLKRSGIEVRRDLEPGIAHLPIRQTELEQLLLNLIGNARDAIAAVGREGRLTVSARAAAGPDPRRPLVRVEVVDDGVGIPAEHLPRVIEPFFTTKPSGNGLGLAICRSIVWQCQGRIWVESPAAGKAPFDPARPGVRVCIEVPVAAAPAQASGAAP